MTHTCPDELLLFQLLEQELEPERNGQLVHHVEHCGSCQQALEALIRLESDRLAVFLDQHSPLASTQKGTNWDAPAAGGAPVGVEEVATVDLRQHESTVACARHDETSDQQRPPNAPHDAAAEAYPIVPGYLVLGTLGLGGMGVVYRAEHLRLKRPVALKMIRDAGGPDPIQLARFRLEAEAVASLRHPNIIQIYDIGEVRGLPYLAFELLEGGNLVERIQGTPQPHRDAARLVAELAKALQSAHDGGIVHRDLKPGNVLFRRDGTPIVSDFGLAKRSEDEQGNTLSGQILGSPSYMAPEQASGQSQEVGPLADVYALGAILYELLTGRAPFKGATPMDTVRQVLERDPVPPSRLVPKVDRDLETICLKCLEKTPPRRYSSADELATDLDSYLEGRPIRARRTPPWERSWKWIRRHPAGAALSGLAAATLVAVVIAGTWYATDRVRRRENEAERIANLRFEVGVKLGAIRSDLSANELDRAADLLGRLNESLRPEPKLAEFRAETDRLLNVIVSKRDGEAESKRFNENRQRFAALRDDALARDLGIAGEYAGESQLAVETAKRALAVFGTGQPGAGWRIAAWPPSATPEQRRQVIEDCYQILLVLSGAVEPDEARAGPTLTGLRILDDAARLLPVPTRAYHRRRETLLLRGGEAEEAEAERRAGDALKPHDAFDQVLVGRELLDRYQEAHDPALLSEALGHLKAAVYLEPGHFWAHALSAIAYLQDHQPSLARAELTACLLQQPKLGWLYQLRGLTQAQSGEVALATATLVPDSAPRTLAQAADQFALAEHDFSEAFRLIGPAASEQTKYALLVNRGTARFHSGDSAGATTDFSNATAILPNHYQAHASLAMALRTDDPKRAEEAYTRAIELAGSGLPDLRASLHRGRAELWFPRYPRNPASTEVLDPERLETVLRDLEHSATLSENAEDSALDHLQRGALLVKSERYRDALAALDQAITRGRKAPGSPRLKHGLERAYQLELTVLLELARKGDPTLGADEAARCRRLETAGTESIAFLVNRPGAGSVAALAYKLRAYARAGLRDFRGAADDYSRAMDRESRTAESLLRRGMAYLASGAATLALADFEESLQLQPRSVEALVARSQARAAVGSYLDAVNDARTAANGSTSISDPRARSWLLYNSGRTFAQATEWAAIEAGRLDNRALERFKAYRETSRRLLATSVACLPESERGRFLQDVLLADPALKPFWRRNGRQLSGSTRDDY